MTPVAAMTTTTANATARMGAGRIAANAIAPRIASAGTTPMR